jgi:hypothetical protein
MWFYDSARHELEFFDIVLGKRFRFSQRFLDLFGAHGGWKGTSEIVLSNCLPRPMAPVR